MTRIFRALCVGAVVVTTVAITPLSASAASTTEFVIVERDGSVDVRTLTQAQAVKASIDPAVRIVQPNNSFQIDDVTTDIVTGLSVPTNAQVGDIVPGRYIVQFELSSLVLLIGIVGAIMLSKRKRIVIGPREGGLGGKQ